MPAQGHNITNAYEFFCVLSDKPLKSNFTYTKNMIITSVNSDMPKEHKAVMKQDVADWFINNFTQENDLILDPFMGYGTTAISCIKHNRNYIGCDISEDYVRLANDRIRNFSLM